MKKARSGEITNPAKPRKKTVPAKKAVAAAPAPSAAASKPEGKGSRDSSAPKKRSESTEPLAPKSVEPALSASNQPTKSAGKKVADKVPTVKAVKGEPLPPQTPAVAQPPASPVSKAGGVTKPSPAPKPAVSSEPVAAKEPPARATTVSAKTKAGVPKAPAADKEVVAPASKSTELLPSSKPAEPTQPIPEATEKARPTVRAKAERADLPKPARQPRRAPQKTPEAPVQIPVPEAKKETPAPILEKPAAAPPPEPPKPARPAIAPIKIPPILLEGDEPSTPPISGPGQKYSVGPPPPAEPLGAGEGELPEAYGTGRLLLAARDPHWLYAHWDLTGEQQRRYNARALHHHLVVRVHRDTVNGEPLSESHTHPESRHWFLHVPYGGTLYVAELGYYETESRWVRISVSNCAATPADIVAEDKSVQFATIRFDLPPASRQEAEPGLQPKRPEPVAPGIADTLRTIALPPVERLGAVLDNGHQAHMPLAELFRQGLPAAQARPPQEEFKWSAAQERALAELLLIPETRQEWLGSIAIAELVQRERLEAPGLPAPEAAPISSPMGGEILLESITSPAGAEAARGKGFWFNVNAELVIYGATEPDAEVTIGGRRIRLRRDGSFSYRFSLPDGDYELPIIATAPHGDERRAILQFRRHTDYQGDVGKHAQDERLKPPAPENLEQ